MEKALLRAVTLLPWFLTATMSATPPRLTMSSAAPYPVDAETAAYWRFEDPPGAAIADETAVNPGTAAGSTSVVPGRFGNARYFRPGAVGDYVTVADNPTLTNLSQITIEAWVFPASCNWYREEIVSKGAQTEPYNLYDLGVFGCSSNDGTLTFEFEMMNHVQQGMGTGAVAQSTIRHPINQWYYVVGVYDGTTASVYVNGTLEATGTDPGVVVTTHDPLYLHNHTFAGGQSNGRMGGVIDEVRISNVARSVSAQTPCTSSYGPDSDTVALWHLDEGSGATVAHDASGFNHDGAVLGAPSAMSGPFGSALVLGHQSSGQWISVPSSSDLDGFAQVTVEAWIFPTDQIGAPHDLVAKGPHTGGTPSQAQFEYELNTYGPAPGDPPGLRFAFFLGSATGGNVEAVSVTHPFNEWLYVAGTYDGHIARIYVNGRLEGQSSQLDGISISNSHPVLINNEDVGASPGDNGGIDGGFANVRISKRARTAEEIASAYHGTVSGSCGIAAYAYATPSAAGINQPVTVQGSASSTGCSPTIQWGLTVPLGSTASLTGTNTSSPQFTPDIQGYYTATLTASCGAETATASATISATSCTANTLTAVPTKAPAQPGASVQISGFGGSGAYTWSFAQNQSDAPPLSNQLRSKVSYTAGGTAGTDIIQMVDSLCPTPVLISIAVRQAAAPEASVTLDPYVTQGAGSVTVTGRFSQAVEKAVICIDAQPCIAMFSNAPPPTTDWTYLIAVAPSVAAGGVLDFGTHAVSVAAVGPAGDQGPFSSVELDVTRTPAVILLLTGYNFNAKCGPHPGGWWGWNTEPSIPCQLAMRFFNKQPADCAAMRPANPDVDSNCSADGLPQPVCVVNTLDGGADLFSPQCYDIYFTLPEPANIDPNCSYVPPVLGHPGLDPDNPPPGLTCTTEADHWHCVNLPNTHRLDDFINSIPWVKSAESLFLMGHSYGGQIARAYASAQSQKVKAVFTLDTPHLGAYSTLPLTKEWIAAVFGEGGAGALTGGVGCVYDSAIHNFLLADAAALNREFPPSGAPFTQFYAASGNEVTSLSPAEMVLTEPEELVTAVSSLVGAGCVDASNDIVVPVCSQEGGGSGQGLQACVGTNPFGGCNFHGVTPYSEVRALPVPPLHTEVIANACSWEGLYENDYAAGAGRGLKASLERALPSHSGADCSPCPSKGPQCSGFAKAATPKSSSQGKASDPLLPPAGSLGTIVSGGGVFTPGAPAQAISFLADSGQDLTVSVAVRDANPDVVLIGPSQTLTPTSADGLSNLYAASSAGGTVTKTYVVRRPATGAWTLQITVPDSGSGPNLPPSGATWSATAAIRSPVTLSLGLSELSYLVGDPLNVKVVLQDGGLALQGASLSAIVTPDGGGAPITLTLFDDGAHGDGASGDGIYASTLGVGSWTGAEVVITASGTSAEGAFQRQISAHISVYSPQATVQGPFIEAAPDVDADGHFDSLNWTFGLQVSAAGTFTVAGDLVASDGTKVSNATTTVAANGAGSVQATLIFPGQDIYSSARLGPYTLTNMVVFLSASDGPHLVARGSKVATSAGPYWSWLNFQMQLVPTFLWMYPSLQQITSSNTINLQWRVADGNGGTTLDLFYDTVGGGFNGVALVTGLVAVNGVMNYAWDVSSLPDGTYFVYARIRNGSSSNAIYGGSIVRLIDTDGDGMPDAWELAHGLNPNDPSDALRDPDGDGLANIDEYRAGTDPQKADTDGGGESDLSEVVNGRDPNNAGDDVLGITVSRIVPSEGDGRGGETLLVIGSGFQSGATVSFGGTAAASVVYVNPTRLLVVTPPHSTGVVPFTVVNPGSGGSATLAAGFTFLCEFVQVPVVTSNGPMLCPGQTLLLSSTASSGGTFSWTGPNGFSSTIQNPSVPNASVAASGTYFVTETVGQCAMQGSVTVSIGPAPPTASSNGPVCAGQDLQLSATSVPGATYLWDGPGGFSSSSQNPLLAAVQATASGVYTVTATLNKCLSQPATTTVLVRPLPTATVSGSGVGCTGDSEKIQAALTGTAPWNLAWSDGFSQSAVSSTPASRLVSPTVDTTYSVTSVSDAFCSGSAFGSATISVEGNCAQLFTMQPCRAVDTRSAVGPLGGPALLPGSTRGFPLVGSCGIPASAKAVSVNVTITQAMAPGDLRLYPSDETAVPLVSSLNWREGQTRANNAIVKMPADGSGTIDARLDSSGSVHFILDVNGYFE